MAPRRAARRSSTQGIIALRSIPTSTSHPPPLFTILAALIAATLAIALSAASASAHGDATGPNALVTFEGTNPYATMPIAIGLSFHDEETGQPLVLQTVHERKLHAFVVSEDLETFWHIHPEDYQNAMDEAYRGYYRLGPVEFPHAGGYLLILDFTTDGEEVTQLYPFTVEGPAWSGAITEERNYEDVVDEYKVTLSPELHVGEQTLQFTVERDGAEVQLEQYLGSPVHVVVARSDLSEAAHTHPMEHAAHDEAHTTMRGRVAVTHTFNETGTYAIYAQVQHEGQPITARFIVDVLPASGPSRTTLILLGAIVVLALGAIIVAARKR